MTGAPSTTSPNGASSAAILPYREEPAVRVPDVQKVRSPTARIARTIDEHALSIHNEIEVPRAEDHLERQIVLVVWSLS